MSNSARRILFLAFSAVAIAGTAGVTYSMNELQQLPSSASTSAALNERKSELTSQIGAESILVGSGVIGLGALGLTLPTRKKSSTTPSA